MIYNVSDLRGSMEVEFEVIGEITEDLQQWLEKVIGDEDSTLDMLLDVYEKVQVNLVPFEIKIRKYELNIKALSVKLKEADEYSHLKSVKAKEEQILLDMLECKELLLDLKEQRNMLRMLHEYTQFMLSIQTGSVE